MAVSSCDHQQLHASCCYDDKLIKLVTTLEEILNHVESKKDEMEILCQETRKLLKPSSPKRIDPPKHESEMNEATLEKKEEKKCDPHVLETPSENELAELNLIDKALEKAQKTWEKECEELLNLQVNWLSASTSFGGLPKRLEDAEQKVLFCLVQKLYQYRQQIPVMNCPHN